MSFHPGWTDTRVERLRELWGGMLSASQIAALFTGEGFPLTRSAVLGKVHRLRLGLRDKTKAEGPTRKPDDAWRDRKRVSKQTKPKNPTFGTRGAFQSRKPIPATPVSTTVCPTANITPASPIGQPGRPGARPPRRGRASPCWRSVGRRLRHDLGLAQGIRAAVRSASRVREAGSRSRRT
jgi:hypothetical protein